MGKTRYSNDHSIQVKGDTQTLSVEDNLTVTTDLTVGNNLTVTTDLTVGNNLTVTTDLTVGNDLTVTNDLIVNGVANISSIIPENINTSSPGPSAYLQRKIIGAPSFFSGWYESDIDVATIAPPNYSVPSGIFGGLTLANDPLMIKHAKGVDGEYHVCLVDITDWLPNGSILQVFSVYGGDLDADISHHCAVDLRKVVITTGIVTLLASFDNNAAASSWSELTTGIAHTIDKDTYYYAISAMFYVAAGGTPSATYNQGIYSAVLGWERTTLKE